MFVSCVLQCRAFLSFYRVSWILVVVRTRPMVLCHVSWDLATFAWKSWSTFRTSDTSECCYVHQDSVPEFIWINVRCVYWFIIMLLDQMLFQICLGTCAWERKVELSLHTHALGDFLVLVPYQISYVSNSNWIRLDLAFLFAFYFSPNSNSETLMKCSICNI